MRRGSRLVRTSAVPRPESPASGLAMQFTASFDHRSPKRFVVTLATGDVAHDLRELARARRVPAVELADLEADRAGVGAHGVARLVHPGADRDHAAEQSARGRRSAATRSSLIPFWKSTTTPFGFARYWMPSDGRPLGVVGLDGDEDRVEGLGDRLQPRGCGARLTGITWSPQVPAEAEARRFASSPRAPATGR